MKTIGQFIKQRPYLVWHVGNYEKLSPQAVLESVLNYGDFNDVKEFLGIIGRRRAALIFRRQLKNQRHNYRPEIEHYFKFYFAHHA